MKMKNLKKLTSLLLLLLLLQDGVTVTQLDL